MQSRTISAWEIVLGNPLFLPFLYGAFNNLVWFRFLRPIGRLADLNCEELLPVLCRLEVNDSSNEDLDFSVATNSVLMIFFTVLVLLLFQLTRQKEREIERLRGRFLLNQVCSLHFPPSRLQKREVTVNINPADVNVDIHRVSSSILAPSPRARFLRSKIPKSRRNEITVWSDNTDCEDQQLSV